MRQPVVERKSGHRGLALDRLRDRVLAGDNRACYIERERLLRKLAPEAEAIPLSRRYSWVLEHLLQDVTTPIEDDDVFLGRVAEEPWADCEMVADVSFSLLPSRGHMTLDWPVLLAKGLSGVAAEAQNTADLLHTDEARDFAANAECCVRAVADFARRYALAARERAVGAPESDEAALLRAAAALDVVPDGPAFDFFSALQSIWIVHLVTSCYIGTRDFAFGHLDRYLLPFYEQGLADGSLTRESATALLAHFLMKTNEITGTATWNHACKPIPCQASKQYLMLAGRDAAGAEQTNELTYLLLDAARLVQMPQPVFTVCMDPDCSERLKDAIAAATPVLGSQIHFYNDRIVQALLKRKGLSPEQAAEYTMGGCCRLEFGGVVTFPERHNSLAHWMLAALNGGTQPASWPEVLAAFRSVARTQLAPLPQRQQETLREWHQDEPFHFESLLLRDCVQRGRDCLAEGTLTTFCHQFDGIATVANSLHAIKTLVFDQRRFTLPELLDITARNFAGHEALRAEILHRLPKFGNDNADVDTVAAEVGRIVLEEFEALQAPSEHVLIAGFYSLNQHHSIGRDLPATPDGRLAGEPVSENQSPVYGTDTEGITALLHSVARLPLDRTAQGGLNVAFGGRMPPEAIRALLDSYFAMGGLHVGFSFVGRQELLEARDHPDRYRTLTVRLYGFSEYFVSLSSEEQQELIDRTRY